MRAPDKIAVPLEFEMTTGSQDREVLAAEYLACMRDLGSELERAMRAIAENALTDLEEGVSNQQVLAGRLHGIAQDLSARLGNGVNAASSVSGDLGYQIYVATNVLQSLNQCYAALLRHSSRCTGQMVSVFQPFQGQEGTGAASKHQTWSCQM